jgi:dTDP-4-dehydrorhamnose 3,5-epimerase
MLFIPKGFLHGFVTITDDVIFAYKCDQYYDKSLRARRSL